MAQQNEASRYPVRVLATGLIVSSIYLLQPSTAEACGCIGTVSSAVSFERADLVFVGTVARVDTPEDAVKFEQWLGT